MSQGVFYRFSNPAGVGKGESMPFCLPERRKIHVGRLENFIDQFRIEPFELKIRQDPHRKVNA